MRPIYKYLKELDKSAETSYGISEELLMENAAFGVKEFLEAEGLLGNKTVILTGAGNNGADGLALARMIPNAALRVALEPKSPLCKLQYERAKKLNILKTDELDGFEVIIDAILGSGASKELDGELKTLVKKANSIDATKIAIDVPSGVREGMGEEDTVFKADFTVTMGALKESLFLDYAKDYVGAIVKKDLGLSFEAYTKGFTPSCYLFEEGDFAPPRRKKQNCNKGDFGHLSIACGDMRGASLIAAASALRLGVGLVTLVCKKEFAPPPQIMISRFAPQKTAALIAGQGLGDGFLDDEIVSMIKSAPACVIDADIFKKEIVKEILALNKEIVLTPHPKEFSSMLKIALGLDVSVDEIQRERFGFARLFCKSFADKTLILKGANTIVAKGDEIYVLPFGSPILAKGGSGDALAGAVGALLSQGYTPLKAALNGVAAIYLSAKRYAANDYSFTIEDLTEGLKWI